MDAIIVGGGIIGSSIALELKKRGLEVLLLERAVLGAESSSAAAGMLAPQMENTSPGPGFELGLWSRRLYPDWVAELEHVSGVTVEFRTEGALRVSTSEEVLETTEQERRWQIQYDLPVERLDARQVQSVAPGLSDAIRGAVYFRQEAQVDPRRLMGALSVAVRHAGIRSRVGEAVGHIHCGHGEVQSIEVGQDRLETKRLVVAAGAWSSSIPGVGLAKSAVTPVRGQMLALSAKQPLFSPFLWSDGGYLVPRTDGRLIVGATVERVGYQKGVTAGGLTQLLSAATQTVPHLENAEVINTWSGLRPWTEDHLPLLGQTDIKGLYVASGHCRNGILQAPATAQLIAELIAGDTPTLDLSPFHPNRLQPNTEARGTGS